MEILSRHSWCEEMCVFYFIIYIHIILISLVLIYNCTSIEFSNSIFSLFIFYWCQLLNFSSRKCLSFCWWLLIVILYRHLSQQVVLWCNGADGNDRHTQSLPGYQVPWTKVSVVCQGCHMINASMMPLIGTQEPVSQSLHSCQGIFSHHPNYCIWNSFTK
jgi:hypothetical protein